METENEKYLPIGTVVMLKGGTKKVMITGFCAIADNDKKTMWDYSGCMFPEGFLSSRQTCLFNHNQIERIYHLGLEDDEEKKFKETLNKLNDVLAKAKTVVEKTDNESEGTKKEENTTAVEENN